MNTHRILNDFSMQIAKCQISKIQGISPDCRRYLEEFSRQRKNKSSWFSLKTSSQNVIDTARFSAELPAYLGACFVM